MYNIFVKEIRQFFSSLVGYMVIAFFLLILGLMIWVFPDYSVLNSNYASLEQLFELGPFLLTFLIPAITMRAFAEEKASGTIEFLSTKPLSRLDIIAGKYMANVMLVLMAILPTLIYVYSIAQLGSPKGNMDLGEIFGSYIGLISLAAAFTALGLLASSFTSSQIAAFLIGVLLCFVFYWGMDMLSSLAVFYANGDSFIQSIGIDAHYRSMSRGLLEFKDLIYFICFIGLSLVMTDHVLKLSKA